MSRRVVKSALVAVAALAASAGPAVSATAAPAGAMIKGAVSHVAAVSAAEQHAVKRYWTSSRMRAATPLDVTQSGKPAHHGKPSPSASDPTQPQLGKVFFTLGGTDYVCSGTATQSANGDVVTTAGHCLNEGPGAYATNFEFVPAYENGNAPYGTWTAKSLLTTSQWKNSGDLNYDTGFAVMNSNSSGGSLTDIVGSYPIAFNQPRGLTYTSYGYPAASPYDGQTLQSCSGTAHDDTTTSGAQDQGIPCDMTGGSSGGGWIENGTLNSVNSYKYNADPNTMYGPYFGDVIQSAYTAAASS